MVKVIWNNDGRKKFDFDYLLKITNQTFVDRVAIAINNIDIKSVKIVEGKRSVEVTVVGSYSVMHYCFYSSSGTIDSVVLGYDDLQWMLAMMGGADNE